MPRLSTKITVKLEPELLQDLQFISESEGLTISRLVREAVYEYIKERRDNSGLGIVKLGLSRFEMSVVNDLVRIGYVDTPEQAFHEAFHDQMYNHGIGRKLEMATKIKELAPFKGNVPSVPVSPSSSLGRRHTSEEDDDSDEADEGQ